MQACKKGKFSSWQIQISVWIFSAVAGKAWIWIRGFLESGWPQENLMFLRTDTTAQEHFTILVILHHIICDLLG
jgi:hypothetical protein